MFPFFKVITICFVRNILKNSYRRTLKPFCALMITVTNTTKVNEYARKGRVVVKKFTAHFRIVKLLFLLTSCHCQI